jgi:hypothetical protein
MPRNSRFEVPRWGIAFAFFLTVVVARLISWIDPGLHATIGGMHIHHYVYGIFVITAAGYLALIFKGPRATSWIALLYGMGVGLTFDEFGFWINPIFQRGVRGNTSGITAIVVTLVIIGLIPVLRRKPESGGSQGQVPAMSEAVISENSD